ncbi:MAG: FMN-binding protein, partial [Muribaculaceae bacterium]|nr:FMN-binding protein [Muribaculaceae bacterium]
MSRFFSLLIVLLMLAAAAISVNKAVFGHDLDQSSESEKLSATPSDNITVNPDGSIVIHTASLPGVINGYAGPVPLDIYIKDNRITDIKALPNVETPSFFNRASDLFDNWIGKTVDEALDMKVDAVSGATYSSTAIINNINTGLASYEGSTSSAASSTPLKVWIAFAVCLAACIIPLFVRNRLYHNVQLIANVIVLGFWCGQFLDFALILKYISSGFILPIGLVAILMLIAAFIYPLFGRPEHYCNHICPLGSAQQLAGELCSLKIHMSPKLIKGLEWFRRILWALLMLSLWTGCLTGWMDLELFQAFQFETASLWILAAAAILIIHS